MCIDSAIEAGTPEMYYLNPSDNLWKIASAWYVVEHKHLSCFDNSFVWLRGWNTIEAGSPEDYYLNPSDNLWKMVSEWNVVEHEDFLVLTIHNYGLGDGVCTRFEGKFINIEVFAENKEKAARFEHKDGMKNFSIEMNPNFLHLGVTLDRRLKLSQGIQRLFISKLEDEEMKVAAAV
ncbi:hypothetical protein MKW98_005255 [Papaver atlanticum]|uniref:Uncharacterized protein n=1 Tax=Papaver atlanticum TaxID=357466 RepID=A0AAD4RWB6_9MAGN|nr:hypothetical protein MKW98_005255 [Papaver atlanticum]